MLQAARGSRTFAFVFICQAGPLEIKALLLAASLKHWLRCDFELIAALPAPVEQWGKPSPATLSLLESMGVRFVEVRNEIDPDYPIGNKVSCLRVATGADRLVFLDTDVLLVDEFTDNARFDFPFAAKPVDLPRCLDRRQWKRAYGAAGLAIPPAWVPTSVEGQLVPPYFNAGFLAVDPRVGLGDAWLDCCRRIDARWGIQLKRPHLDQIALPVAIYKLGIGYYSLEQRYNYPAHLRPIDASARPMFVHYHPPTVLRREPILADAVKRLCDERPALGDALRSNDDYAPLLHSRLPRPEGRGAGASPTPEPAPLPELIITGIPRSGTSYLCNLLHRFDNCVILNEPDAIARPIRKEPTPWGVSVYYRDVRRDVLEGRPIFNKLRDGQVTDETLDANSLTEYTPAVTSGDFVLGVKSPLGFLSRLSALRRAMPRARVIACVRNPFDTIASWKASFEHLAAAEVGRLSPGGLRDPFLAPRQRLALEQVAAIRNAAWRRAAWWRYLAQIILDAGDFVMVVPYSVAVTDPAATAERILRGFNAGATREPIVASTLRSSKRSGLDAEDLQAIRALCGEAAAALGVCEDIDQPTAQTPPRSSGARAVRSTAGLEAVTETPAGGLRPVGAASA